MQGGSRERSAKLFVSMKVSSKLSSKFHQLNLLFTIRSANEQLLRTNKVPARPKVNCSSSRKIVYESKADTELKESVENGLGHGLTLMRVTAATRGTQSVCHLSKKANQSKK